MLNGELHPFSPNIVEAPDHRLVGALKSTPSINDVRAHALLSEIGAMTTGEIVSEADTNTASEFLHQCLVEHDSLLYFADTIEVGRNEQAKRAALLLSRHLRSQRQARKRLKGELDEMGFAPQEIQAPVEFRYLGVQPPRIPVVLEGYSIRDMFLLTSESYLVEPLNHTGSDCTMCPLFEKLIKAPGSSFTVRCSQKYRRGTATKFPKYHFKSGEIAIQIGASSGSLQLAAKLFCEKASCAKKAGLDPTSIVSAIRKNTVGAELATNIEI